MTLKHSTFNLSSPALVSGEIIPLRFTQLGKSIQPPLSWEGVPSGTQSLALICTDMDAPLPDAFTHWVVTGISPEASGLEEGVVRYTQGFNDLGTPGYIGPMPPEGHGTHHYYFWLYALNRSSDKAESRSSFLATYREAIIAQTRLVCVFAR